MECRHYSQRIGMTLYTEWKQTTTYFKHFAGTVFICNQIIYYVYSYYWWYALLSLLSPRSLIAVIITEIDGNHLYVNRIDLETDVNKINCLSVTWLTFKFHCNPMTARNKVEVTSRPTCSKPDSMSTSGRHACYIPVIAEDTEVMWCTRSIFFICLWF